MGGSSASKKRKSQTSRRGGTTKEKTTKKLHSIQRQLAVDDGREENEKPHQPSYWSRSPTSSRRRSRGKRDESNNERQEPASSPAATVAAPKRRRGPRQKSPTPSSSRSPRFPATRKDPEDVPAIKDDSDDESNNSTERKDSIDHKTNDDDISKDDDNNNCSPPQRGTPRKRKAVIAASDDAEDSDADSTSDFEPTKSKSKTKTPRKKKKKKPANTTPKSTDGTGRGPESNRTCPHCHKVFTVRDGMEYHVAHFVCRPALKPGGRKRKAKKTDNDKATSHTTKKQKHDGGRGPKEERTCPKCNRVFTSVNGMTYHVDHRVCELQFKSSALSVEQHAFGVLSPGDEFVTPYGVVRVVRDDRETPTTDPLPEDTAENYRRWKNTKARRDTKRKSHYQVVTVHSLARRLRLGKIGHGTTRQQQQPVWEAYFGSDPTKQSPYTNSRQFPSVAATAEGDPSTPHPLEPPSSFPNRIVECVLVRDARKVVDTIECNEEDEADGGTGAARTDRDLPPGQGGMRLFLRRKVLADRYNPDITLHRCVDCGKIYSSKDGYRFHRNITQCTKVTEKKKQECQQALKIIQRRAEKLVAVQTVRAVSDSAAVAAHSGNATIRTKTTLPANPTFQHRKPRVKKTKIERASIYPQVLVALKFRAAPASKIHGPRVSFFGRKTKRSSIGQPKSEPPVKIGCTTPILTVENVDNALVLDDALDKLKQELVELKDQSLGPVYPEVYKFLNFKNPSYLTTKKRPPEKKKVKRKRLRQTGPPVANVPPPSPQPDPGAAILPVLPPPPPLIDVPIIDVRVLAGEVDLGRFPSIKRNPNSNASSGHAEDGAELHLQHEDNCYICKKSNGLLHPCGFCDRCIHLECLRTKFIVKNPEPHDDFMCNKCIQYIITMRRRAEKRRLEKLEKTKGSNDTIPAVAGDYDSEDLDDAGVVKKGREFEHLARQAQRVEELVGLLEDSKSRLDQYARIVNVNNFRRSHIINL